MISALWFTGNYPLSLLVCSLPLRVNGNNSARGTPSGWERTPVVCQWQRRSPTNLEDAKDSKNRSTEGDSKILCFEILREPGVLAVPFSWPGVLRVPCLLALLPLHPPCAGPILNEYVEQ